LLPIDGVKLILISGARWARDRTAELQALFPKARIIEFYGASETSFVAWMNASEHTPAQVVGYPFAQVAISVRDMDRDTGAGLIFVRSPMLFMDYVGEGIDSTAALRDGPWLSVRDMGYLDAMGRLCLVGRHNRMIVTQGKNLFPEELEAVLVSHEGVLQASVHGMADAMRGMQVAAVLQLAPGAAAPGAQLLSAWCRERLEAFKAPRRYFVCSEWPLTSSGKTDHAALGASLQQQQQTQTPDPALPCLTPLS
jgi:acyl-CoA synthetase (AMP-forming)/AMP-acid ligase II